MSNKKTQANMQINVSFLANTQKLVKELNEIPNQLHLDNKITDQLGKGLNTSLQSLTTNLNKLFDGLSKPGLSAKQYTAIFDNTKLKIQDNIKDITTFGTRLEQAYKGMANTKARAELKKLEQDLQRIKDLMTESKSANTWASNAKDDFKNKFGIDFDAARSYIESYRKSKKATKGRNVIPTATTQKWMDTNKFDIKTMNETLGFLSRVEKQESAIKAIKQEAYEISKKQNLEAAKQELMTRIDKQKESTYYEGIYKANEATLKNLIPLMKEADNIVEDDMVPGFNKALISGKKYADEMTQGMMTLRDVGAQFGLHFTIGTAVQYFKRLITEAFEFYKSLDSALNEIYVVSNLTSHAINGLTNDFINMAKETGMALDKVTKSATLFYQQGLNTDEVMEMTEVTAQFAKVAGIDAVDAADKLTAAVNGYCLAAEDASLVADKFNKVAAASAADIDELSTAFSKAAAQANQAGVGMDNYLAYIATMVEATREAPENIGTSLKTIFSRMQQVKEAGTTEDGETDVNKVETALKSVGIALRDTSGELRDLEDVFDELGPKWQSLDRNTQAYIGTIVAGTRQQSRFITLMQNWDRVLDLSEQSANSAGMQALMHAKAMDSITSKMQVFRATWQEFISNIASSDIFKGIISGATKLLDLINSGQQPMALITAAFGLFAGKLKSVESFLGGKITKFFTDLSGEGNKEGIEAANAKLHTARQELGLAIKNKEVAIHTKNVDQERVAELRRIAAEKAKGVRLAKQELAEQKRINREHQQFSRAQAIGMGVTAAGMAVSNKNENIGGLMTGLGTAITGGGLFGVSKIAGVITLLSGLYQIIDTGANWQDKNLEKLENSINNINQSLQDYSVLQTGVKATESLLEKYDELRHKVMLTNTEQETLNDTIQQLADTYNIDTVSDEYGNLSININEVNDALDAERQKAAKAREELIKLEKETKENMTTGLFGIDDWKIADRQEYYDRLLSSNAGDYKGLLNGLKDNLGEESRIVSRAVANEFSSNFKIALIEEMKENGQYYLSDSIVENLEGIEQNINKILTDSNAWDELYGELGFLEENLNSLTFEEVQGHLNNFYYNYMEQTGMAIDEWNLLVDAINNTLFDNSSLIDFIQRVQTEMSKANGSYYKNTDGTGAIQQLENQLETINQEQKAITDQYEEKVLKSSGFYLFDTDLTDLKTMKQYRDMLEGILENWQATPPGAKSFGDTEEETRDLFNVYTKYVDLVEQEELIQKRINALYEEKNKYIEKYAKEYGLTVQQAKAYLNASNQIAQSLSKASNETISYLNNINNIYNFDDIKDDPKLTKEWGNLISNVINNAQFDSYYTDAEKAERMVELLMGQRDTVSGELKNKLEEAIDQAFNALELPSGFTFSQIADEVDSITEDLRSMNELVEKFNENGGFTLEEFMDLAKILDSINIEELFAISNTEGNGPNYVDKYITALKNLDLALEDNSGQFTMNGEALKSLQDIQEAAAKASILNMKNEMIAKKTQVEAEMAYIDAQIKGAETTITLLGNVGEGGVKTSEIISKANEATNLSFTDSMTKLNNSYSTQVQNLNTWTQATLTDLGLATEAWGRYWLAASGTKTNLDDLRKKANETLKDVKFEGINTLGLNNYGDTIDEGEADEIKHNMQVYINNLKSLKDKYQQDLNLYNAKIALLDELYNSDLSNLGLDSDKLEKYIGELREIYNILNRINLLEHRLNTLDSYSKVAIGEEYGQYLKDRLRYTEELSDQYEFLVTEQKKFTNGYKDFIEASAVGHVFDFDEFGQIIINFEEYEKLQDTASKGNKSLLEQADEMYKTYTGMFEELQGYFDEYIEYLQKSIDLHQEVIDSYVKVENDAADAIKEIYQKILDDKLDAIDKEIDALNDLKEAREKANKEASNAKEVSGIQSDIQRAMMDTSGASDINLLQAQDKLDEKLNEMAEDKYSEMLENIIDQLEDEQDALQDEFDEMFENLEWLYSFLETNIMGDREKLEEIFTQTEEWATTNNLERAQQLQDLDKNFHTYMANISNGKTIYDIWARMEELKQATKDLDQALRTRESKIGLEVAAAIKDGLNGKTSGSGGSGGSGDDGGDGENPNPNGANNGSYDFSKQTIQSTTADGDKGGPYEKWIGKTVEIKGSGTMQVYDSDGATKRYINNPPLYNPNVIIQDIGLIDGEYWARTDYKDGVWIKIKNLQQTGKLWGGKKLTEYMRGGLANFTGPAWLDGTPQKPEAVLNALQTEHFIKFTNALDKMFSGVNAGAGASSVSIENISFNVDSMSSVADGEKAFDAFVNKFKEIGNQKGIKINSFKNTL